MSDKNDSKNSNNIYVVGGAVAVIAAILGFFTMSSFNTSSGDVMTSPNDASEKTIPAKKAIKASSPEEIVVTADKSLVEKAHEAAIQNQVNEAVKNAEESDFSNEN